MNKEWIESRIALAEHLGVGECGGSSAEAVLILSSLISGIAADLWPGKRIDPKRFTETWARYSNSHPRANFVSVPLLIGELDRDKAYPLADRLRATNTQAFMPRGLPDDTVVTGEDVDLPELTLSTLAPELALAAIRRWSYGNVFYVYLRSGYVHEYQAGTHADPIVMSDTRSSITYGNYYDEPYRRINFDIGWVASVARSIVDQVSGDWKNRPLPVPSKWWIDGAAF